MKQREFDSRPANLRPSLSDQDAAIGYGSATVATVRLVAYFLWSIIMVPVQAFAVVFFTKAASRIPLVYHRNCLRAMGAGVLRHGRPLRAPATLYVANHTSYLDITVLGALLPAAFVAKAEIKFLADIWNPGPFAALGFR